MKDALGTEIGLGDVVAWPVGRKNGGSGLRIGVVAEIAQRLTLPQPGGIALASEQKIRVWLTVGPSSPWASDLTRLSPQNNVLVTPSRVAMKKLVKICGHV